MMNQKNKELDSQYTCKLYELYENQVKEIVSLCENLLRIVKFIEAISFKREKYEQQLKNIFFKLKNSG